MTDWPVDWAENRLNAVMPIGKGVVLIGMGERTTYRAVARWRSNSSTTMPPNV